MSVQTITTTSKSDLTSHFPEWVTVDERQNYSGYLVKKDHLLEFARRMRDKLGFDYLSMVTATDYFPEDRIDVVYMVYKSTGGSGICFKVAVGRTSPVVPSLVSIYPSAEFQEREVWDLFGVRFDGHPDLRRILLWEGFAGYPLRKDWREAFYEEEAKPLKSRWPEGHVYRHEDKNAFGDNVSYPPAFDPDTIVKDPDESLYKALRNTQKTRSGEMSTEQMIVNMGPQHPSTHGVFRMAVLLEGETIVDLKPAIGYLHRNHEKIGERNTFMQNMPFTDRLDYVSSMSNNFGYAVAVEKLLGIQPPERAEYLRVIMAELTRISSHLIAVGFLLNDLGAFFTPALYGLEERELILDIFEAVSGARMMCNYFRFGGVVRDLPEGVLEKIKAMVYERLPRKIDDIDKYLTKNEIIRTRCEGVGVLTPENAIACGCTGPLLRASGIPYDVRRAEPYSIYERFDFEIPTGKHGDIYDRYLIRLEEMRQSLRILQQALKSLPEGPIQTGKIQYQLRVPAGEAYGRVEGPKGELGFYVVSNGKANPVRYHIRPPSFVNLTPLAQMCQGSKIADVVVILGSIDIVLGEVDR